MTDITIIVKQFDSKILPKKEWTHNAHIAVAFAQLHLCGDIEQATNILKEKIKAYNLVVGTENSDSSGYHETLTIFWLKVITEFRSLHEFENINEAYNAFLKTLAASSKFPTLFYSKGTLFSTYARQNWAEPDLLPITEIRKIIIKNMEQHFI